MTDGHWSIIQLQQQLGSSLTYSVKDRIFCSGKSAVSSRSNHRNSTTHLTAATETQRLLSTVKRFIVYRKQISVTLQK